MGREICHGVLAEALGVESINKREADKLFDRFDKRVQALRSNDPAVSYNDALARVAKEWADDAKLSAALAKRTAMINHTRRTEAIDYLVNTWGDDPGQGLKAILVGTQDKRMGARAAIGTDIERIANNYMGGLHADVMAADGGLDILTRGDMDGEIAGVLDAMSRGQETGKFSKTAQTIGAAIRKWQEKARTAANDAGAWIGKVDGFITTTYHDSTRIAKNMDAWVTSAKEYFDLPRMADEMGVSLDKMDDVLADLWSGLASGIHLKVGQPSGEGKRGLKGMGKKLSHERVIHFNNADSWLAYNKNFGAGTLYEAVAAGLQRNARSTAVMNGLGPSYESNFTAIIEAVQVKLRKSLDASKTDTDRATVNKAIEQFKKDAPSYKRRYLAQVDGSLDIPANDIWARRFANMRAIQTMASLGYSTLTSIADLGVSMLGAKYNGLNMFDVLGGSVGKLFTGVPKAEKVGLLADLGVVLQSLSGRLAGGRFTPDDDIAGRIGKLQNTFFKWNLQNHWTDSIRGAVAEMLSANLARRAGDAFDGLPPKLKDTLGLYGIDSGKWDIFRSTEAEEMDGSRFLSPKLLDDLPDDPYAGYLRSKGIDPTAHRIKELRNETQNQFRAYFSDQNGYMLLTPDQGTLGMMRFGTQKGTGIGEAVRTITQFKSYSVAYGQKIIGREFKQGGIGGIASMIALTTVFGYVSNAAKDRAKFRTQRDPTDWRTAIAALQNGGGLGLYGDVLFSQVLDRRFKDALISLAGPTASDANTLLDLVARATRARDGDDAADLGAASFRFIQGNTPFINLFYTKILLDYGVLYRLQEWMNPGSLARMEQQMQERSGQQFVVPPSETVR